MKELPLEQLDELKSVIFTYVVLAPLLAALFADKIDKSTTFLLFAYCLWDSWGRLSYI